MPLTEKLTINFMVVGVASIMILGILSYWQHRRALIAQAIETVTLKTDNWRQHFSQLVIETAQNIHANIPANDVWQASAAVYTSSDSLIKTERSDNDNHMFFWLSHENSADILTENTADGSLQNSLLSETKGYLLTGYVAIDSMTHELTFRRNIRKHGVDGTVLNIIFRTTNPLMLPVYGAKTNLTVCLSGPDNRVRPLNPNQVNKQTDLKEFDLCSIPVSAESAIINIAGQPIQYIRLPLHPAMPGWSITGMADATPVLKANAFFLKQMIAISLLIAAVFFVFVYLTARRFVRPIRNLTTASLQTSFGNYIPVGESTPNDETGELTQAFNQMTQRLRQQQEELGQERIRRLKAMIDSQELERKRVSRELHEGIAQDLAALKFTAGSMCRENKNAQVQQTIHEIENLADRMIERIRQISNNLSPTVLGEFGLGAALRFLASETKKEHGIQVTVNTEGLPARITGKLKTYLYRIIQESILNAIRHSEAGMIEVSFSSGDKYLDIIIEDDGKAFTPAEIQNPGYGLYNIRERVELLKGTLAVTSENRQGTRISLRIPLGAALQSSAVQLWPKKNH